MRRGPKPTKSKEAKPPVARKSPKGTARVRDLEKLLAETLRDKAQAQGQLQTRDRELAEAREQQTATSEILRVISRSPTDIQPVFEAIAENSRRLCDSLYSAVYRADENLVHLVAHNHSDAAAAEDMARAWPMPLTGESLTLEAMRTRSVVHIADVESAGEVSSSIRQRARLLGNRSFLSVPMLRVGKCIGAIRVSRSVPGGFSDRQVDLLKTFADQAVIAIENVRLFNETKEALEQQTATSEILHVISSSPTDIQPVFDAIVQSTLRLCGATFAVAYRYEGDKLYVVAHENLTPAMLAELSARYPQPPSRETATGVSVLEGRIVHIPDPSGDDVPPASREFARQQGWGSMLAVPLLRNGRPVGNIAVSRVDRGPFSEQQLALVQMFADQAVIAIENVRLFKELEEKNRALTEAHAQVSQTLEQQTATGDILRVIASSPTDVQPVFTAMAASAARLCEALDAAIYRIDGDVLRLVAHEGSIASELVLPLTEGTLARRVIRRQRAIHVANMQAETHEYPISSVFARQRSFRTILSVPLLHGAQAIGLIAMRRTEVRPFTEQQIALLETFADQAVIAIQNVRLFKELEVANRELAAASQHKSEFLANMSHELRTPLNAIIGFSEVLSDRMFGELNEKQEEYLKDIYASGTHLLSLINDILDLSKIEAGRMELELTDFDLPTAIENALMLVRERAGRRSIALHTNIDSRLGQIQADERKVRQVVLNLLSNAIKFTPEGGRIEVGAVSKDGFVAVSVSDTGIGIAPQDQEKVFEEFRQVGTAAKKIEGTGLGLTLCRKFIELHGGRIWVKSQEGEGSTFTFTIPVRRREE
jgi:signal transduction histidine kinase